MRILRSSLAAAAVLSMSGSAFAQSGAIAFTGFNADGLDNLAFVVLRTTGFAVNDTITFSDNEFNGTVFADALESDFTLTFSTAFTAGQIVTIDNINSLTATSNAGTIVYNGTNNLGIGNSGETLYAFSGTLAAPGIFYTAVTNAAAFAVATGTLAGTGLVEGQTALRLTDGTDIGVYTGGRAGQAAFADYLPLLNNNANFLKEDGGGDQSGAPAPNIPFDTTAFTINSAVAPEMGTFALLAGGLLPMVAVRLRRRNAAR